LFSEKNTEEDVASTERGPLIKEDMNHNNHSKRSMNSVQEKPEVTPEQLERDNSD
jgi:hypothetical protein